MKTSQPLKKILKGNNQSSRVADWANQVADFSIEIELQTAIKVQALAYFIAKTAGTTPNNSKQE